MLAFCLAMLAEMFWPRREPQMSLAWRWLNNLSLAAVTWYVGRVAGVAFTLALARWTELHRFGLFMPHETCSTPI